MCHLLFYGTVLRPILGVVLFSLQLQKKKINEAKRLELENRITNLEQQHKHNPSPSIMTALREARRELDRLITGQIEGQLRFAKQKYCK